MKVADSSTLAVTLDLVANTYGFESVRIERVLTGGMFARPVLLDTDRGLFVRRIHTFRNTEPAFRFQAEAVESVWRQGVACSRVEPTRNGHWCTPIDGSVGVEAVHWFVEGQCDSWMAWHSRKGTHGGFLHLLGRKVAELHNALDVANPGGDSALNTLLPVVQFRHLDRIRAEWRHAIRALRLQEFTSAQDAREQLLSLGDRIETHWQWLAQTIAKVQLSELPMQIVHGDISPVNIVIGTGSQFSFIDWDCVHVGHRMYDALGDVLNRPPHDRPRWNRFNREEVDEYVDGYASGLAQPLTKRERQMTPAFCLARQLEDLRQRLSAIPNLDASEDQLYATLIGMRVDMMDQIAGN
jgi:Ser/Thr protein kinase RdoA (MazF antagonist)